MTDKYKKLISLIPDCPKDIEPEDLAEAFNNENNANMDLAKYSNRLVGWLDYIYLHSRGKAREWATNALMDAPAPREER